MYTFFTCSIFGHEGSAAGDIMYINWLNMVRAGLLGLEYYTPEAKKWRQVSVFNGVTRRRQALGLQECLGEHFG